MRKFTVVFNWDENKINGSNKKLNKSKVKQNKKVAKTAIKTKRLDWDEKIP